MWDLIKGFVDRVFGGFNNLLEEWIGFDEKLLSLYNEFIAPQPELFKIIGFAFFAIIVVLGVISFVKKMVKLFLVIAIILAIIVLLQQIR